MTETTYNGWANYATWAVHLWLTNDEATEAKLAPMARRAWAEAAGHEAYLTRSQRARYDLAAELKDWAENDHRIARTPAGKESSLVADLLGYALGMVDWDEMAENYLADADLGGDDGNGYRGYETVDEHRTREAAEAAAAEQRGREPYPAR